MGVPSGKSKGFSSLMSTNETERSLLTGPAGLVRTISQHRHLIALLLLPMLLLLPCLDSVLTLYFSSRHLPNTYPDWADFGSSPPPGWYKMEIAFVKDDLKNDWHKLIISANLFSDRQPSFGLAVCRRYCDTSMYQVANASGYEYEETNSWSIKYPGWYMNTTLSMPLESFSPYLFPADTYSTPELYVSVSKGFVVSRIELTSFAPAGFVAFFEEIRKFSKSELPEDLQSRPEFAEGSLLGFKIGMTRSQANLLVSTLYAIFPALCMYEVGALSFSSVKQRKDRLTIYVGVLFSVFTYFLTLRQFLPPSLTYLEALIGTGMTVWILVEALAYVVEQYRYPSSSP